MNSDQIHSDALVIDTHIDTATHLLWRNPDFSKRLTEHHVDIPRLREGGVDAAFFAVWIDEGSSDEEALKLVLRGIDAIHRTVELHSADLELVTDAAGVLRAKQAGKISVLISIEGGRVICDDLGVLRMLHGLGVRSITLAWSSATNWIDSHNDHRHGGLTPFGARVVSEMQRLDMLVDISHVSDEAFYQVLKVADRPVFASHSSCRSLWDHTRNMSDQMIEDLAANGGVINVNFVGNFIGGSPETGYVEPSRLPQESHRDPFDRIGYQSPEPGPPFSRLIDHFNHALKIAGPDHVGFGSDYDGTSQLVQGLEDISKLPTLTSGLIEAGHSEDTVRKILGSNNIRLFEQTLD